MKFRDKLTLIIDILKGKGEESMSVVMFLANRIVIGKLKFSKVPEILKAKVCEVLEENELGYLCEEE